MSPLLKSLSFLMLIMICGTSSGQIAHPANPGRVKRCRTEQLIKTSLERNPALAEKWRREGERRLSGLHDRNRVLRGPGMEEDTVIIPVVFHLVDEQENLEKISDRNIYDQLQILNDAFHGKKADRYRHVIPAGMYERTGRMPLKFVMARKTPQGKLTDGIQRRINKTPGIIDIKSHASGGLDAWDTEKYLNVWAGSFSGEDDNTLGVATPPFYTDLGPQGVVIGLLTLPHTTNRARTVFPTYMEGATLVHEIGHYFYLWHTFGDKYECNNDDFRTVAGWPLPTGAGPEGDDTPPEKAGEYESIHYGNPSMNYSDGCTSLPIGMMYGSFMNYFDDRALFMFSKGMKSRVLGCIDLYRPGLKTSTAHTAPVPVRDVYITHITPYGTPEERLPVLNDMPVWVRVLNYGNATLNRINLHVQLDDGPPSAHTFAVSLRPGQDTVLFTRNVSGPGGNHQLTVYSSKPNGMADDFLANDTIQSFLVIQDAITNAPFREGFDAGTMPPAGWKVSNPYNITAWTWASGTGFTAAGAATMQNFEYNAPGQPSSLITPAIDIGSADSALLTFRVAYAAYSFMDVSTWDGLEIYISSDGGHHYDLAYKKTGKYLATADAEMKTAFTPGSGSEKHWRRETVNLTPYLKGNKPPVIEFRATNAYGNNLYLDDIAVVPHTGVARDIAPLSIQNLPQITCSGSITPKISIYNWGKDAIQKATVHVYADGAPAKSLSWTGNLKTGDSSAVNLPAIDNPAPGAHTLTVYTSGPNGLADLNPLNDTIKTRFYVAGHQPLPVIPLLNGPFPPANWLSIPASGNFGWEKAGIANSMVLRNSKQNAGGSPSKFVSPVITRTDAYDSLFVSFDYAYFWGAAAADTLEMVITRDCGKTVETVWKKGGADLQTVEVGTAPFVPEESDWSRAKIDVLPLVGEGDFQVILIGKGKGGNDIYVRQPEIYGVRLPERLKEQGYLIYPNPFGNEFIIRHYEDPTELREAAIFNSAGQKVWQKRYRGDAYRIMPVQVSGLPKGVYTLRLVYSDKKVVEKIVRK